MTTIASGIGPRAQEHLSSATGQPIDLIHHDGIRQDACKTANSPRRPQPLDGIGQDAVSRHRARRCGVTASGKTLQRHRARRRSRTRMKLRSQFLPWSSSLKKRKRHGLVLLHLMHQSDACEPISSFPIRRGIYRFVAAVEEEMNHRTIWHVPRQAWHISPTAVDCGSCLHGNVALQADVTDTGATKPTKSLANYVRSLHFTVRRGGNT